MVFIFCKYYKIKPIAKEDLNDIINGNLFNEIKKGSESIKEGKGRTAEEVFKSIKKDYNL